MSDFSYGEFIYSTQDGQIYKYFSGLQNKTWDFVSSIVNDDKKLKTKDQGQIIQNAMGRIADKDGTTKFYQNEKVLCPTCGASSRIQDRDNVIGIIEIGTLTFDRFERQTSDEKRKEIEVIIK